MDKVLWIRHEDRLACVEAGITGSALEAVLASALVVFFWGGKRCEILTKNYMWIFDHIYIYAHKWI